ncbi:pex6 [Symbiodinium natans]|uniref:Pex6 protein n=1 Tax=Symbiodinium natans TaxID=878477 RepID=A0A812GB28_9DINO|nr:pex6 [Symbiodinium natans]
MNFQVERSDDDDDSGGPVHPCIAICVAMVLIVIAPYFIWHTEGDYIKTLEVLEAAEKGALEPCKGHPTCSDCDFSKVKDGDLIYLACPFSNLKTLDDVRKEGAFNIQELTPALSKSQPAAAFSWEVEMYQFYQDTDSKKTVTVTTGLCPQAQYQVSDADKRRVCCQGANSPGRRKFEATFVRTTGGACHPAKPRQMSAAEMFLQESLDIEGGPDNSSTEDVFPELEKRRRLRKDKDDDQRDRDFTCSFDCRHWRSAWSSRVRASPATWMWLPDNVFSKVEWLDGAPAANIPSLPLTGSYSNVKGGPDGVSLGGVTMQEFKPERGDDLFTTSAAATLSPTGGDVGKAPLQRVQAGTKKVQLGTEYTSYTRSAAWTNRESKYSSGRTCIESVPPNSNEPLPGDLRVCFSRSDVNQVSVLAGVKKVGSSLSLVLSDTHLRAKTELRSQTQGYVLRKNKLLSLKQLVDEEKSYNVNALYFGRVVGPLILWAAFYCFLSPLIWVVDKFGDTLKGIPCIGGVLGFLADFVETLVTCLVCMVSCSLGLACGLLAMAVAWLAFRPVTGAILLTVSVALFVAVIVFGCNQQGQKGVRRRSARQPEVQQVEMNAATVQPAAMMAQPVAMPVAAVVPTPTVFQVQCPAGTAPGTPVMVTTPDGRQVTVQVPAGVAPGQMFQVQA